MVGIVVWGYDTIVGIFQDVGEGGGGRSTVNDSNHSKHCTIPATGRAEDPMGSVSFPPSPQFIYLDLSLLRFLQ